MADDSLSNELNSLQISNGSGNSSETEQEIDELWGLSRREVYKLALKFYKEKEGSKAVNVTYKDKLKLVALTKQVSFGKYRPDVSPDVGFLDVVGNDRRLAWLNIGDVSKEEAMKDFIDIVNVLCPLLKPYIEAHKREKEEQERKRKEELERLRREEADRERMRVEEQVRQAQELEKQKQLQQQLQIRNALNQQTALQFRQYAEQQCPNQTSEQDALIKQLQEQHFQQYMQQVYQQQVLQQQQQYHHQQALNQGEPSHTGGVSPALPGFPLAHKNPSSVGQGSDDAGPQVNGVTHEDSPNGLPIAAPSMWTRKDIKDFKESIRKDPDSVIKVGSGETVTVRVPTHDDGTCLFWEFASDHYDLGFGVYFEWTIAPSNAVSVHVSESSDEEDDEESGAAAAAGKGDDVEKGSSQKEGHPPTDEIIPVYRRDCNEEVYCGSHMYPGRGVYLLKFDNSYSLWRAKTMYYRVYYTR